LNAALACVLALFLVLGVGTLADRLDDSIRSEDELTALTGLPVLGMIPYIRSLRNKNPSEKTMMVVGGSHQRSPVAEAFRATRTGIAFSGVNHPWQTLLVASPLPSEGKSTIALNVAAALAEAGKSVILVDLDLWHRSISRIFDAPNAGLTNLLLQPYQDPRVYFRPTQERNLSVLPSGPLPPNPAELIGSPAMADLMKKLRGLADCIIVDSPALLAVADAAVVAALCDAAVLVVKPGTSKRRSVQRAIERLRSVNVKLIGVVVNSFGRRDRGYYDYAYYNGYYHTVEEDQKDEIKTVAPSPK
jgi:capsular exopolysaccharide synthesis family protein